MDQNAPRVAGQLRALAPEIQRAILAKAFAFTASRLGGVAAEVSELLNAIQTYGKLSPEQAAKAVAFADEADKRSFQLEEQDAPGGMAEATFRGPSRQGYGDGVWTRPGNRFRRVL